jgi:hypothetical protein
MTKLFKLVEYNSGIEPGICFSGDPESAGWEDEAQAAADLLAEFIEQSDLYEADYAPEFHIEEKFYVYDGDDLNCRIVEMDWKDFFNYSHSYSYDFDLRLSASEMEALGFAEYESGQYESDAVIHFRVENIWAEDLQGNLLYDDLNHYDLLNALNEWYIGSHWGNITIV